MTQAKGILARRREETESLYRNPKMCGYFVGVTLRPDLDRAGLEAWLRPISKAVDELVARLPAEPGHEKGEKVAAVAVGLAPGFFLVDGRPRFEPPLALPAGFDPGTPESTNPLPWDTPFLGGVPRDDADVLFYVASVYEARVAHFIEQLEGTRPDLSFLSVARGYQRVDGSEPFGYADGVRNMPNGVRSTRVFVGDEREVDEPAATVDGSYLAFMRIVQHPEAFRQLADDTTRDSTIGRQRDGTRLDLIGTGVDPKEEPTEPKPNLPVASHVGKAGPRGRHDDTQIFRRGLPFMEVLDGQVRVGLNFASFQSNLDEFDTVLNDWLLSPNFPAEGAGPDALFDPALGLTTIERIGFYFVPPHDNRGLAATLLDQPRSGRPVREGRLVVRKRVVDPSDAMRRFERGGFVFRVLDTAGQEIGEPFTTSSSGRAVFGGRLALGSRYVLEEIASPVANIALVRTEFEMTQPNQQLRVINTVTQPNTPYGG